MHNSGENGVRPQWSGDSRFRVGLLSDSPGMVRYPATSWTSVSVHIGPPSLIACRRGGENHRGTAIHGDVDIIPHGIASFWELKERDSAFVVSLAPELLRIASGECELDPGRLEIRNRFQVRDAQIEHIAWALRAEMEQGWPSGRLYRESLATALTAKLVREYSSLAHQVPRTRVGFSGRKLKQVLAFIEDKLSSDLSLDDIAEAAGLSISHCKVLFRQSVGVPIHQYVIRRRVERAVALLRQDKLSITQIALESGFSHQSHLALHMRRLLGVSPREFRATLQ